MCCCAEGCRGWAQERDESGWGAESVHFCWSRRGVVCEMLACEMFGWDVVSVQMGASIGVLEAGVGFVWSLVLETRICLSSEAEMKAGRSGSMFGLRGKLFATR